jgi:hypothetical protein
MTRRLRIAPFEVARRDLTGRAVTGLLCLLIAAAGLPVPPAAADDGAIRLTIESPEPVVTAAGVSIPGYAADRTPGAPALPVWTTTLTLPGEGDWSLDYTIVSERTLVAPVALPATPVQELAFDRPPSDIPAAEWPDLIATVDRPDPAIYGNAALYPAEPVQAGPVAIRRGQRLLPIRVYPIRYNPVTRELRYLARVEIVVRPAPHEASPVTDVGAAATDATSAAALPGLEIRTRERGMHQITYDALSAAGVPVATVDPAAFAIAYLNEPVAIEVTGEADGSFDPGDAVIFYAEPYVGRYMTENVYRLTWSGAAGERMATVDAAPALASPPLTTIRRTARVEVSKVYYSTYHLPRDVDHFFDNPLYANSAFPTAVTTYTLTLDDVALAGDARLTVRLHGGQALPDRSPDQSVALRLNGASLGVHQWDGSVIEEVAVPVPATDLLDGPNNLALEASLGQLPGVANYWVSPDWAQLAYGATATAHAGRLFIEATTAPGAPAADMGNDIRATGFPGPGIRVYDVSEPRQPVRLAGVAAQPEGGSYAVTFAGQDPAAAYYLAAETALLAPVSLRLDAGSAWRSPAHSADYIAVVHRSLWDAVQPLLDHRAAEGLRVAKVDIQDVYDEFSGGRVDPEALRTFLAYAYETWNAGGDPPAYVLLVGDGHYDFKGALRPGLPNLIPPYLADVDPFIGETAADNRYASVDGPNDFLPDMAIGRIPAKTPAEVTAVVGKILAYETAAPPGAWQDRAVFVADNKSDPAGNFHSFSDQSRALVPPAYDTPAIYYKAGAASDTAAEMTGALLSAFDAGALYLQWFGHASRTFWGNDKLWELNDPPKLAPNTALPFTASYGCWSGYFINVIGSSQYGGSEASLGETLLLTPGRGSVADFSPTGLHIGADLIGLNEAMIDALLVKRIARVGLAVDGAKAAYFARGSGALDLIDTQVLLGDPATRLKLPDTAVYLPLILHAAVAGN